MCVAIGYLIAAECALVSAWRVSTAGCRRHKKTTPKQTKQNKNQSALYKEKVAPALSNEWVAKATGWKELPETINGRAAMLGCVRARVRSLRWLRATAHDTRRCTHNARPAAAAAARR